MEYKIVDFSDTDQFDELVLVSNNVRVKEGVSLDFKIRPNSPDNQDPDEVNFDVLLEFNYIDHNRKIILENDEVEELELDACFRGEYIPGHILIPASSACSFGLRRTTQVLLSQFAEVKAGVDEDEVYFEVTFGNYAGTAKIKYKNISKFFEADIEED